MTRLFIILCAIVLAVPSSIAKVVLGFPGEEAANIGIIVRDLTTGSVLAENDSKKVLLPASVMKTVTAATAITTLDKNFRFQTEVYLTSTISNGICDGDLIVKSCGDPTIESKLFKNDKGLCREISDALLSMGIRRIKGMIKVDQSLKQPGCIPEWEIADVGWDYGAGLFGFNYKDNECRLWPATRRTSPHLPGLEVTTIQGDEENIVRGVFSDHLYAISPNPSNPKWSVSTTMPDPAAVFLHELAQELSDCGISVDGNALPISNAHTHVCTHVSPALDEILREMIVHSHNLYAEAMLRAIAPSAPRNTAIRKETELWRKRGISTTYMKICDGSGLARADRISAAFVADVLQWMTDNGFAERYTSLFPRVGKEGTVRNFLKGTRLEGKLVLKTGSMNAVQCYAGYKLDDNGVPTHIVVVLVNGFYCDRPMLRNRIERFLLSHIK